MPRKKKVQVKAERSLTELWASPEKGKAVGKRGRDASLSPPADTQRSPSGPTQPKRPRMNSPPKAKYSTPLVEDSDSDDSLDFDLATSTDLMKRAKTQIAKSDNAPRRSSRHGADGYSETMKALRLELDLEDSDSEMSAILNSRVRDAGRSDKTLKKLVKELDMRASTEEEREALNEQIQQDLYYSDEDDGIFALIPGAEELQLKGDELYLDTELHWQERYNLRKWDAKKFATLYESTGIQQYLEDCEPLLEKYINKADQAGKVAQMIKEGLLTGTRWTLSNKLMDYLFHTVCYCQEDDALVTICFQYLDQSLQSSGSAERKGMYYQNECFGNAKRLNTEWVPSAKTIRGTFRNFGIVPRGKSKQPRHLYLSEAPPDAAKFPTENFTLFLRLLSAAIQHGRAEDNYGKGNGKKLMRELLYIVCGLLIDPMLPLLLPVLQHLVGVLVMQVCKDVNVYGATDICELLFASSKKPNPKLVHHIIRVTGSMPFVPQRHFLLAIRTRLALRVLKYTLKDKTPLAVVPISVEPDYADPLSVPLEEIVQVTESFVKWVLKRKEEKGEFNFTNLYAQICLIDYSLDKELLSEEGSRSHCVKLQGLLADLNLAIPNGAGMVDIARTRVKEYLSRLAGTVQMVQAAGLAQRTSRYDPQTKKISQFFKSK